MFLIGIYYNQLQECVVKAHYRKVSQEIYNGLITIINLHGYIPKLHRQMHC
jgi:hypothetical protein